MTGCVSFTHAADTLPAVIVLFVWHCLAPTCHPRRSSTSPGFCLPVSKPKHDGPGCVLSVDSDFLQISGPPLLLSESGEWELIGHLRVYFFRIWFSSAFSVTDPVTDIN